MLARDAVSLLSKRGYTHWQAVNILLTANVRGSHDVAGLHIEARYNPHAYQNAGIIGTATYTITPCTRTREWWSASELDSTCRACGKPVREHAVKP